MSVRHFNNRWPAHLPLVSVPCPLCRHTRSTFIHRENGFRIVRCASCRFVYVNPRPTPEGLRDFYQRYIPDDSGSEKAWAELMRRIFEDARGRILASAPSGRILDIGCGLGHFIHGFSGGPWTAVGIDLNGDAVRRARSQCGVDAREGPLEVHRFPDAHFDAITLFYVLEHAPDPASLLREVHRILRPGGLVLIRVPHMEPLIHLHRWLGRPRDFFFPPMHLGDFNPRRLQSLLHVLGFTGAYTTTGGSTAPPRFNERLTSRLSSILSGTLEFLSAGHLLLPGVSKTTVARKRPVGYHSRP